MPITDGIIKKRPITDGLVKKINRAHIKEQVELCTIGITSGNDEPIENYIDLNLLKKLKVRRTRRGWVVKMPKSAKLLTKKEIKNNLSLLFSHSRDGDIETIKQVVNGDIYHVGRTNNPLIEAYYRLTKEKIWNINCGDILGKTEALQTIMQNYRYANRGKEIFVLVHSRDNWIPNPWQRNCFTSMRELRELNKKYKKNPNKPVLFSDNIRNAQKKVANLWNIEYRGGFYGNSGTNL